MADLFISYAREDQGFARRLHEALKRRSRDAWVDWDDIPPTATWREEVSAGVSSSDVFVFVLSPDSLSSPVCSEELGFAVEQNKRIVPVLRREPDGIPVPDVLAELNWIFFYDDDDFEKSLQTLVEALDTDLERCRLHTRLLVRAGDWADRGQDASRLLRGSDLREAEAFLAQSDAEPEPTARQREYVAGSRRAAARRQRALLAGVSVALVVSTVLGVFAFIQRGIALDRQRVAVSRALTVASNAALAGDPELSVLLASAAVRQHATPEGDLALRRAVGADQLRATLRHGGPASQFSFTRDGRLIATASADGTARLWDVRTGRLLHVLRGHTGAVAFVSFSNDGVYLVTAGADSTARVWQTSSGQPVGPSLRTSAPVSRAEFTASGTTIATAGGDGALRLWDRATGELRAALHPPAPAQVGPFALSPDGQLAVTGDRRTGTVQLWDLRRHRARTLRTSRQALQDALLAAQRLHPGQNVAAPNPPTIKAVAFSPDGQLLAAGDDTGTALVYSRDGRLLATLHGSRGVSRPDFDSYDDVLDIAFSPDGHLVATAGARGNARVWQARSGRLVSILPGTAPVQSVRFSPDGQLLVTGAQDDVARVWQVATGDPISELAGHTSSITEAAFSPDGGTVATAAAADDAVRLWRPEPGRPLASINPQQLTAYDTLPAGQRVLTVGADGIAAEWDTSTGALLLRRQFGAALLHEQMSTDGRTAVIGTANAVLLVDTATLGGQRRVTMRPARQRPPAYSGGQAASRDGTRVIAGSSDGTAYVWDGSSGRLLFTLAPPSAAVGQPTLSSQVSADGRRAMIVNQNYTATVWDLRTGRRLYVLSLPSGAVTSGAVLSADGSKIATTGLYLPSNPSTGPAVFDAAAGRRLFALRSKFGGVASASFGRHGRSLITAGQDGSVTIWDLSSGHGQQLQSLPDFTVNDAEFNASDTLVVVASQDGRARVFDARTGSLLAVLAVPATAMQKAQFSAGAGPITTLDGALRLRLYACDVCGSTADVLRTASHLITRQLTAVERARYPGSL